MKKQLYLTIALISALCLGSIAKAQTTTPMPENYSSLDGIITRCIVSTKRQYAVDICEILSNNANQLAKVHGINLEYEGIHFDRNSSANPKPANTNSTLKNPLLIDFFVRGTDGKSVSASIRITAYVNYQQAVEVTDTTAHPRSGNLVLWEKAAVANGPSNRVGKALAAHMTKNLKTLILLFSQRKQE